MIHAGDVIANAVTGEELTFIKTARETNGEAVVLEARVRPNGAVAAAHFHPHQEERFQILAGTAGFRLGRKKLTAVAGDELVVPARTAHRFWNAGDDDLRFRAEVRPALEFEALIETMFNLANDGKTNRKGLPNPFRMAVIAKAYRDVIRLPFPPVLLQDMGLALGVPMGRMLGYQPVYVPAAPAAELPAGT
jgi:mannose-6-phosphate isomerase-like protein (cupin superfamily)